MKSGIHPSYTERATITCGCGAVITTGSTRSEMNIDVCANCHPFYTGKKKRIDATGRVDRFEKLSKKSEGLRPTTRSKREKLAEKSKKKAEKTATPSSLKK
ncbi:MAG: 50S ribosomal protein L31 [Candidatus Moraniibacteriota bacterium]|nr:MAG: 50S ribosomal protein L31 [Candidatus Moranbacteria bacterium]